MAPIISSSIRGAEMTGKPFFFCCNLCCSCNFAICGKTPLLFLDSLFDGVSGAGVPALDGLGMAFSDESCTNLGLVMSLRLMSS